MQPLEIDPSARERLWKEFSAGKGDFAICLTKCYFHAVEANVLVERFEEIDELEAFLLKAVNLLPEPSTDQIDGLLHLGSQMVRQSAIKLVRDGLLSEDGEGCFHLTRQGLSALESGRVTRSEQKRRLFHFVHDCDEFLRIRDPRGKNLQNLKRHETPRDWKFDADILKQCIAKSKKWKMDRRFPFDIIKLVKEEKGVAHQQIITDSNINLVGQENSTSGPSSREKLLILDKAQVANCAIVVRSENEKPVELNAYALTKTGFLRSPNKAAALFSLNGTGHIQKVFPDIVKTPSQKNIHSAWMELAETFKLEDATDVVVSFDNVSLVIKLDDKKVSQWLDFSWQVTKNQIFCCVECSDLMRLYHIKLEGDNSEANEQLSRMQFIYELHRSDKHIKDVASYQLLASKNGLSTIPDVYNLASFAWKVGEFQMAYTLAELEDMKDVKV